MNESPVLKAVAKIIHRETERVAEQFDERMHQALIAANGAHDTAEETRGELLDRDRAIAERIDLVAQQMSPLVEASKATAAMLADLGQRIDAIVLEATERARHVELLIGGYTAKLQSVQDELADFNARMHATCAAMVERSSTTALEVAGDALAQAKGAIAAAQDIGARLIALPDVDHLVSVALDRHGPTLVDDVTAQLVEDLEPKLLDLERRAILAVQAAIPAPRDGRDGDHGRDGRDGKDGRDGVDGQAGLAGTDGEFAEPKPFTGAAKGGALIAHRGGTWFCRRDTETPPSLSDDWRLLANGVASAALTPAEERGSVVVDLTLSSGEHVAHTVRVPGNEFRGVWRRGHYQAGDTVSRTGSTWIAERDTEAKPGDPESGWRLAVKCGDDGRDGAVYDWRGDWKPGRYKRSDVVKAAGGIFIALRETGASPPLRSDRNDDWDLMLRACEHGLDDAR